MENSEKAFELLEKKEKMGYTNKEETKSAKTR